MEGFSANCCCTCTQKVKAFSDPTVKLICSNKQNLTFLFINFYKLSLTDCDFWYQCSKGQNINSICIFLEKERIATATFRFNIFLCVICPIYLECNLLMQQLGQLFVPRKHTFSEKIKVPTLSRKCGRLGLNLMDLFLKLRE